MADHLREHTPCRERLWLANPTPKRGRPISNNGWRKKAIEIDRDYEKIMDSVSTSCIQLAKEQFIKYSDPKYNINDFKTGDCETMLLNQTISYLNKSKSKWISVGLYYPFEFASVVKIFGRSKQYVIFKEEEWIQFHEQRENINKYFQTFDTMWKPRQIGSKTLTFEMIEEKKILRIEDMCGNEVYLGWQSVSENQKRVCDSIRKKFGILKRQRSDAERELGDTYRPIIELMTGIMTKMGDDGNSTIIQSRKIEENKKARGEQRKKIAARSLDSDGESSESGNIGRDIRMPSLPTTPIRS
ncbi:hypothetical protein FQA39_LY09182 [Lamprigera yunnana]|nr:hypothetical protein FQA39_LY09182 [Lamprigera yunnana]